MFKSKLLLLEGRASFFSSRLSKILQARNFSISSVYRESSRGMLKVPLFQHCFKSLGSASGEEVKPSFIDNLKNTSLLSRVAIVNADKQSFSYGQLFKKVYENVNILKKLKGTSDLNETRVAYMIPPNFDHVAFQWAIWGAGGIAVPLCVSHPSHELEYTLQDSGADIVIIHPEFADNLLPVVEKLGLKSHTLEESQADSSDNSEINFSDKADWLPLDLKRGSLFIYTSGTTGRPKGVVSTHHSLTAQLDALTQAWNYSYKDKILHVLPLHHVHGVVNAMSCVLYNGGTVEFLSRFRADTVWSRFMDSKKDLTLFMAVPTIYSKLVSEYDKMNDLKQKEASQSTEQFRLMVSGSSALPGPLFNRWRELSGHTLLERYGMSEIGMALSNPLNPVSDRKEGHVGVPLPSVEVRLVEESEKPLKERIITDNDTPGEIQIKGPSLFKEYWNRPDATKDTFEEDGWFKTGDTGICTPEGSYRILGRSSVDIIKCGGYKISALEIEKEILAHSDIAECAVLGIPDEEYGERVTALLVLHPKVDAEAFSSKALQGWLNDRLARYKVPTRYILQEEIPKNAMGKINKKELRKSIQ